MLYRYALAAAVAVAFVLPAAAATKAKVYYAEQSVKTKACYVVSFKPDGKHATQIGTDSFKTLKDAEAAIKADKDCAPPPMKPKAPAKPKTT